MKVGLWKFRYANRVSIVTVDGQHFDGEVITFFDAGETVDGEDRIDIILPNGEILDIAASEIQSIRKLK